MLDPVPKRKSGINSSGAFPLWVTLKPGPDTSEQGKYHSKEVANASATSFLSLLGAGNQVFGERYAPRGASVGWAET